MNDSPTSLTLAEIARRLDEAGITWAVFAGAAASAYGSPRSLTDVDILVPAAEGDRLPTLFPEAQVRRREDTSVESVQLTGFDILAGLAEIDLDAEMAVRLTHHDIIGVTAPVIPPEDNILLKAIWGRGPEEGKHDWEDVQAMMTHLPALDWAYLRWRSESFSPPQHVRRAVERLEALWREARTD